MTRSTISASKWFSAQPQLFKYLPIPRRQAVTHPHRSTDASTQPRGQVQKGPCVVSKQKTAIARVEELHASLRFICASPARREPEVVGL